jgi:hypothetical protein
LFTARRLIHEGIEAAFANLAEMFLAVPAQRLPAALSPHGV